MDYPKDTTIEQKKLSRRNFLGYAGVGLSTLVLGSSLSACSDDEGDGIMTAMLTNDDIGILNFAYALEQLEAAFYTQVVATPYSGITTAESTIMNDLKNHEVIHREFFKEALGSNAIGELSVDFSSIDFSDRSSVLGAAKTFEDLGVSAYNGAGEFIQRAEYLVLAGKIVSVEARHAAAIRDLLNPKSIDFAGDDIIDSNGLDKARKPSEVLSMASSFIVSPINSMLP